MNIVDQLLIGSGKLNLMQSEITKIIKMLVVPLSGEFPESSVQSPEESEIFTSWLVGPGPRGPHVELIVGNRTYCDDEVFSLEASHIRPAHDLLNDFVVALLEYIPDLRAKFSPMMDAAA